MEFVSSQRSRSKKNISFLVSMCLGATIIITISSSQIVSNAQGVAPDNLISTFQIIFKLCYFPGVDSEKVAWQFIGCYDRAPGKPLFFRCQKKTFNGRLFDSVRNIERNCQAPQLIPKYASCLMKEFKKSGIDMNKAVRKLNACQLPLLQNQ